MKTEETPWSKGLLLVCTKCHKSISPGTLQEEGNCGENLKSWLKKSLQESGDSERVRVVTSSCLKVCVKEMQAVAYVRVHGQTEIYTLSPEMERDQLLKLIKAQ